MDGYQIEDHPFQVKVGSELLGLRLRRFFGAGPRSPDKRRAVLLLHGGNSGSDTFLLPEGGVVAYLWSAGYDVWLLDWRGSPHVTASLVGRRPIDGTVHAERELYTMDAVAHVDIPRALDELRERIPASTSISVLGHCLSSGILSMAIGSGQLRRFNLASVVLSTLGLFFEVPWNGWIKAEDFIVERIISDPKREDRWVNPRELEAWPPAMAHAHECWPKAWNSTGSSLDALLLQRLTFMVGRPFVFERLHPSIRGNLLQEQFGALHLGLYQQASQCIRRGFAGRFDEPDVLDRPRLRRRSSAAPPKDAYYFQTQFWSDQKVTLIGGSDDQLWHRDSVDLMYEWLRGPASLSRRVHCAKHVVRGYRLQELYWAANAAQETYPLFRDAL